MFSINDRNNYAHQRTQHPCHCMPPLSPCDWLHAAPMQDGQGLTPAGRVFSLEEQIEHKAALLRERFVGAGRPPLVILGHSIGKLWLGLTCSAWRWLPAFQFLMPGHGRLKQAQTGSSAHCHPLPPVPRRLHIRPCRPPHRAQPAGCQPCYGAGAGRRVGAGLGRPWPCCRGCRLPGRRGRRRTRASAAGGGAGAAAHRTGGRAADCAAGWAWRGAGRTALALQRGESHRPLPLPTGWAQLLLLN